MESLSSPRFRFRIQMLAVVILAFVFLNGFWNKHKGGILKSTFTSVYKDRLMAESYLLELTDQLQRRNQMLRSCGPELPTEEMLASLKASDHAVDRIVADYQATELTAQEAVHFDQLKHRLSKLHQLEAHYLAAADKGSWMSSNADRVDGIFAAAAEDVVRLSRIQVDEGRLLNERSSRIIADSTLLSDLQMAVVFIMGMLIHAMLKGARHAFMPATGTQSLN